jgi:hypothetical protein
MTVVSFLGSIIHAVETGILALLKSARWLLNRFGL